jgi:hypothetical protein
MKKETITNGIVLLIVAICIGVTIYSLATGKSVWIW